MIDAMLDLHLQGAGNSPKFMPEWSALADRAQRQYDATRPAGRLTAEYDQHVDASVRRYLKATFRPSRRSAVNQRIVASSP